MNKYQRRREGIKRAERVLSVWRQYLTPKDWLDKDGRIAHLMAKTRKPCSCPMCGNPRRHYGEKTIQEKKADIFYQEQLADYDYIHSK